MRIVTVAASTPQATRKGEGDVIELSDGRVLIVYMEFTGDGSDIAKTSIVAQESADGGLTWHRHRTIATTDPGDVNVYSPNLLRALDGSILLSFMRQHTSAPPSITHHILKSTDEGVTFRPYSTFAEKKDYSLCNAVIKRLDSGRILLPVSPPDKVGSNAYAHTGCVAVLRSDDDGKSWTESANRVYLPMRGAMEPHVEQTRDGRILMVMRNQLGSLFMSESRDMGVTWSTPQTTGLRTPESCPELTRIPSTGDLLMIWNNSEYDPAFYSHYGKRSPLTAAVSTDEGRTWSHVRDIDADPTRALTNPGCRFLKNGTAIVNYWTCVYLPNWAMQDVIDLRAAIIPTAWFYAK